MSEAQPEESKPAGPRDTSSYTQDEWEALARDMAPLAISYPNDAGLSPDTLAFLGQLLHEEKRDAKQTEDNDEALRTSGRAKISDEEARALGVA